MTSLRLLTLTGLLTGLFAFTASPSAAQTVLTGTIDDTDPIHADVLAVGIPSTCTAANYPGIDLAEENIRGETHLVTSSGAQCVTVTVTAASGPLYVAAYSTYNSADISSGFLGGPGACVSAGDSFQFAATGNYTIVVEECSGTQGSTTYTLTLTSVVSAVSFRSLSASPARGGVLVRWRTASEVDTLGFHVYRQVNGKRVRVNRTLIAAKGRGNYSFLDRKAPRAKNVRYWLRVVNLDGSRSWYGPAAPRVTYAAVHPLVGRWEKVTTCQQIVDSLRRFGLEAVAPAMLAGNGLVPGTPAELAAKDNICSGAVPRVHSHFFTRSGQFGSLDWNRRRVDEGAYRIVDSRTLRIGKATFRYRISIGKRLALTPVISASAKRQALANPLRFSQAGWMVAVALPAGGPWKRVRCAGWC